MEEECCECGEDTYNECDVCGWPCCEDCVDNFGRCPECVENYEDIDDEEE